MAAVVMCRGGREVAKRLTEAEEWQGTNQEVCVERKVAKGWEVRRWIERNRISSSKDDCNQSEARRKDRARQQCAVIVRSGQDQNEALAKMAGVKSAL